MHECSGLPELLDGERRAQVATILDGCDMVVLSCLFWRSDVLVGPRRLADTLLHVLVAGRLRWRIGGAEFEMGPGEMAMVADGVEHEAWLASDCDRHESFSLHLHAYTRHNLPLAALFASPVGRLPGIEGWRGQLALLCHLLGRDPERGRAFGASLVRALFLTQALGDNPLSTVPEVCDERIWLAMSRMLRRHAEPLSVAGLAREAGLGVGQFRKLFLRHAGATPKAFLQDVRLRQARALLHTNPLLTIKEVAERTGFASPNYLHAAFRQRYGLTPADCRAEAAADQGNGEL